MVLAILLGIFALFLIVGGTFLGLLAWRNFRTASLLGRPLSRAAKLRPGIRRVRGQIAPLGEPLSSPVTNRPCVYYRLRVYEDRTTYQDPTSNWSEPIIGRDFALEAIEASYRSTGGMQEGHSWHRLVDEMDDIPFTIEDDTGGVEVDLRGAAVLTKERARIVSNDSHPPSPKLGDWLLDEYGIHTVDERGFFKTLHFIEEVLLVGAKVTVVGPVGELKSGDFCFRKKGDDDLLVSDRDVAKEGRSAHGRAMGYGAGAGGILAVALVVLIWAAAVAVRALAAGR